MAKKITRYIVSFMVTVCEEKTEDETVEYVHIDVMAYSHHAAAKRLESVIAGMVKEY